MVQQLVAAGAAVNQAITKNKNTIFDNTLQSFQALPYGTCIRVHFSEYECSRAPTVLSQLALAAPRSLALLGLSCSTHAS